MQLNKKRLSKYLISLTFTLLVMKNFLQCQSSKGKSQMMRDLLELTLQLLLKFMYQSVEEEFKAQLHISLVKTSLKCSKLSS